MYFTPHARSLYGDAYTVNVAAQTYAVQATGDSTTIIQP